MRHDVWYTLEDGEELLFVVDVPAELAHRIAAALRDEIPGIYNAWVD